MLSKARAWNREDHELHIRHSKALWHDDAVAQSVADATSSCFHLCYLSVSMVIAFMGLVELLVLTFLGMKLNNHYEFNVMKIRDSRLNATKEMVNYMLDSYMTGQTFVEGVVERVDGCSGDITIKVKDGQGEMGSGRETKIDCKE
ncbi:hypothetical protein NE237_021254 [Protea cynaroides]|uniref:Uncharacterized protein n=1 Tax=Protea cynaroides TaxID=273540 RepID=A0A9Q0HCU2_9MAGN|nr:hypothetical protein NE237_021254 [Protea cynaroides]